MPTANVQIHPSAEVSTSATVGEGTRIWHQAQVRDGARIGRWCIVGKDAYVGVDVVIGDRVKIQNGASIYHGATIEDGVFVGPHVCLTNDKRPRAITPEGHLKEDADWDVSPILIRHGASIGAGAVILPGVTVGRFAMVGAGAVVTKDVVPHGLVIGNPARLLGFVCACGHNLIEDDSTQAVSVADHGLTISRHFSCPTCGREYTLSS
jgi:acetyltransferase-like isoleucine patch superfamily enzyme